MDRQPLYRSNTILGTIVIASALCAPSLQAAQVQSALPTNQIGVSVKQLLGTTLTTNIALPAAGDKPAGMGNAVAGIHLGTNTDIYAVGVRSGNTVYASEFWVRYSLDASSNEYHQSLRWDEPPWEYAGPVSGALWLSFNLNTQQLNMYTDKVVGNLLQIGKSAEFDIHPGTGTTSTLRAGVSGDPDYVIAPYTNSSMQWAACIECDFTYTLNLAFLQLYWTGSAYDLRTSAQGFDQVFTLESYFDFGLEESTDRYYGNIAPVPVPAAAWLFGSGLLGLVTKRRRPH